MKIVLTGGGTAGHVMPHLALLDQLKKHFDEIHFIGSQSGIERAIIETYPEITYHPITTVKLKRGLSLTNLVIPFKLIKGINEAKIILKDIKPSVIFSKGGFVALPVCSASKKLKIPVVSHESDYSLGLANKIIYKKCNSMCCSFEPTTNYGEKCIHTGSAIRTELLQGNKENCIQQLGLNPNLPTICITGGSLGALRINQLVNETKSRLLKNFNIIHLCGKGKKILHPSQAKTAGKYIQLEFVNNPANIFACCDIAVCRAGSNTIFEFLALGKPMLLLPLSKKASRGDQILNSIFFKEKGFASYILDENLSQQTFIAAINKLYDNRNAYIDHMKKYNYKNGNDHIISEIIKNIK